MTAAFPADATTEPTVTPRTLRPILDRVVVRRDAAPTHVGLIEIPESARERHPETAVVVAVGPGRWLGNGQRRPVAFAPGERVVVSKYAGLDWNVNRLPDVARGKERSYEVGDLVVLREIDVFAVVEPASP